MKREKPTDLRHEPPFPGLAMVMMSMRDGETVIHSKRPDCDTKGPHDRGSCGSFVVCAALDRRIFFGFGSGTMNSRSVESEPRTGKGLGWYYRWGNGDYGPFGSREEADAEVSETRAQVDAIMRTLYDMGFKWAEPQEGARSEAWRAGRRDRPGDGAQR